MESNINTTSLDKDNPNQNKPIGISSLCRFYDLRCFRPHILYDHDLYVHKCMRSFCVQVLYVGWLVWSLTVQSK